MTTEIAEPISQKKNERLDMVIDRDSTNFQWVKLILNFGMLAFMILTKLIRGPGGGQESLFGLDICDNEAWAAYAALWIFAIILTLLAVRIARKEYQEKTEVGYSFT